MLALLALAFPMPVEEQPAVVLLKDQQAVILLEELRPSPSPERCALCAYMVSLLPDVLQQPL